MAKFIPSLKEIENNRMEKPTEGEWFLLQKLQTLNDNYTVYFQSHINILHPDIVITAKGRGVMIIEVKDWNLEAYEFIPERNPKFFGIMKEKRNYNKIRNPFKQVKEYKDELYDLFCSTLFLGNLEFRKVYGVVCSAIFFYKATELNVKSFFQIKGNWNEWNRIMFWGRDSNISNDIEERLWKNSYFTDEMYLQISSLLKPSLERREQAEPFTLSKEQERFAISEDNKRQKIKGVAGSGKTLVLAQRAVNCFQRTKAPILILTYNITLHHYIQDKIAQITRDFSYSRKEKEEIFCTTPIFQFIGQMYKYYNNEDEKIFADSPDELIRKEMKKLKEKKDRICRKHKYKTILIDEVQDFKYEWLVTIDELFLDKRGEFVLFGDEKQNIYDRELENRLPRTNIKGAWSKLKETYRLTKKNTELALQFQKKFFSEKYEENDMNFVQMNIFDDMLTKQETRYYDISNSYDIPWEKIIKIIENFRIEGELTASNDICILSSEHEILRELEFILRTEKRIKTTTISETKEEYNKLCKIINKEEKKKEFDKNLKQLRRTRKYSFRMNAGVMKLCTIHSFKGWEINTIFLILGDKDDNDELIYTAITRAKKNLIIINYKNCRYKKFFEENLDIWDVE